MEIAVFQFSLFGINCYVVFDPDSKEAAIVDPGIINKDEADALDSFVVRNNLKVTNIINTHLHIDHALANATMAQIYSAQISAHKSDQPLLDRIQTQADQFGLPFKVESSQIDRYLEDGDVIKLGEKELKVIHVPGHSQGSIALYSPDGHFLISGDALFAGSIGRTDLPGGNHSQLIKSIKEKLFPLPGDTMVYPGHGHPTTIAQEMQSNPFFK